MALDDTYAAARLDVLARTAARFPDSRFGADLLDLAEQDRAATGWGAFLLAARAGSIAELAAAGDLFGQVPDDLLDAELASLRLQVWHLLGRTQEVAAARTHPLVGGDERWGVDTDALDRLSPDWVRAFNDRFAGDGLATVVVGPGDGSPFDRVSVEQPPTPVPGGPRVSVVMPVHNPDLSLVTAVGSVLRQSWTQVEVLLCDDASTGRGRELLEECAALDPRIRLLRSDRQAGAYDARNRGLAAATGEFVTFNDADDWSHPERLALQVQALLEQPEVLATTSRSIRVTSELALTNLGNAPTRMNMSSLLFRRAVVVDRLGGFDAIRKSGDAEFIGRIRNTFGFDSYLPLPQHLALVQLTSSSLSRGDFPFARTHPARLAYKQAFDHWHTRIRAGEASPYVAPGTRADFPAPAHLLGVTAEPVAADVALLANPSLTAPGYPDLAAELESLCGSGLGVAVIEALARYDLSEPVRRPDARIEECFARGDAYRLLPGEPAVVDTLLVRDPDALEVLARSTVAGLRCRRGLVIADHGPLLRTGPAYDVRAIGRVLADLGAYELAWLPATAEIAEALVEQGATGVLEPRLWARGDPDPSSGWELRAHPRVGIGPLPPRMTQDQAAAWLEQELPRLPDVRVHSFPGFRAALGGVSLPRPVKHLAVRPLALDESLRELDYLVVPDRPGRGPQLDRLAVRALANGCVPLAGPGRRAHFGDAVIHREDTTLDDLVTAHRADPAAYSRQIERGRRFLEERLSEGEFRKTVAAALSGGDH